MSDYPVWSQSELEEKIDPLITALRAMCVLYCSAAPVEIKHYWMIETYIDAINLLEELTGEEYNHDTGQPKI